MSSCKTLIRTSLSSLESNFQFFPPRSFLSLSLRPPKQGSSRLHSIRTRRFGSMQAAISLESINNIGNILVGNENDLSSKDNVERLLTNPDEVTQSMKMETRCMVNDGGQSGKSLNNKRWFPYLDRYRCGDVCLSSGEVVEAVAPYLMEERKEKFMNVVKNQSYSVCLVVEGLSDFGNVSATFRSADALGVQSVDVVSCDSSKRCTEV